MVEVTKATTETKGELKVNDQPTGVKPKELIAKGIVPEVPQNPQTATEGQPASSGAEPSAVDTFTNIDPQKLPDELKSIYNSMLSDYKRKTQDIADKRKNVTFEMKQQAIEEALSNMTREDFDKLTKHPQFQHHLETTFGNSQVQPEVDLSMMTDTERKLWEQNQSLQKEISEIKNGFKDISQSSRMAAIAAQDAELSSRYKGVYNPDKVNSFIDDVINGRRQLSREDIHRILDYERANKHAYEWGKREVYEENPNRETTSLLHQFSGGGEQSYEIPAKQPKEHVSAYMSRLFENAKKNLSQGKSSPYVVGRR